MTLVFLGVLLMRGVALVPRLGGRDSDEREGRRQGRQYE
jgi:hypothetical protein